MPTRPMPVALTIAGSDSGGGAGIQADLKTFAAHGVFGTCAVACVTAQNPDAVTGIASIPPRMVARQMRAVLDAFPVAVAKTGMLHDAAIVRAVAAELRRMPQVPVVVDPVMVATSGARLLRTDAIRALMGKLLPLATVITPNLPEAEVLLGRAIGSSDEQQTAARELARRFGVACVVKGGHLAGDAAHRREVTDVLCVGGCVHAYRCPRVPAAQTHGTGCTFSAALAANLALGLPLPRAVANAQRFVYLALLHADCVGRFRPLGIRSRRFPPQ
jgi:hydroxymethylpyrimidine kinase/phosphomethylpyrimidine kinase